MATASFAPCPHCNVSLSYLEGVSGSRMSPKCPRCRMAVTVSRATLPHARQLTSRSEGARSGEA